MTSKYSHLLTSKGCVIPRKTHSLPKLELTTLQVGTQLAHYISKSLSYLKITAVNIWSDNEPALQWICNDWSVTPFVKICTAKIHELSDGYTFLHVGAYGSMDHHGYLNKHLGHLKGQTLYTYRPLLISHMKSCLIVQNLTPFQR